MDRKFIYEMSEAYYNDNRLHQFNIWKNKQSSVEELYNEITSTVDQIWISDNELYYELKSYDKFMQRRIMYNMLTEYLKEQYDLFPILEIDIEEETDLKQLNEIGITPFLIAGAVPIIVVGLWKHISRAGYTIARSFGELNKGIYNFIREKTKSGRVKHSILISHFEVCAKKCGLRDKSDLDRFTGQALTGAPLTQTSMVQADCLKDCYLDFCIEQIGVLTEAYINCLKSTGEDVGELSNISILLRRPLGEECDEYYKYLERFNNDFRDVLDVLFKDDNRGKQDMLNRFNKEINNVLIKSKRR